jgi:hypothetical protein
MKDAVTKLKLTKDEWAMVHSALLFQKQREIYVFENMQTGPLDRLISKVETALDTKGACGFESHG